MTDSGDNGGKEISRDPLKAATILLIVVAVIMLAFLIKNCVTDSTRNFPANPESTETTNTQDSESDETEIIN